MDDGIQAEPHFPLRERHHDDDYAAIRKQSGGLRGWAWLLIAVGVVFFCGVGALILGVLLLGGLWLGPSAAAPPRTWVQRPAVVPVDLPATQAQSEKP